MATGGDGLKKRETALSKCQHTEMQGGNAPSLRCILARAKRRQGVSGRRPAWPARRRERADEAKAASLEGTPAETGTWVWSRHAKPDGSERRFAAVCREPTIAETGSQRLSP